MLFRLYPANIRKRIERDKQPSIKQSSPLVFKAAIPTEQLMWFSFWGMWTIALLALMFRPSLNFSNPDARHQVADCIADSRMSYMNATGSFRKSCENQSYSAAISVYVMVVTLCSTIGIAKHAMDGSSSQEELVSPKSKAVINNVDGAINANCESTLEQSPCSYPSTTIQPFLPSSAQRRVHFGEVMVREMCREAGGGGAVSSDGVPLGLGWTVVDERCSSVTEFEAERAGIRREMDAYPAMGHMNKEEREQCLLQAGVHWTELVRCFEVTDAIRQEREDNFRAFMEEEDEFYYCLE